MSELIFLEEYDGQTLNQLLELEATHRIDSLVLAIEQALLAKPGDSLGPAERTVVVVEALEREVNNGGFDQFFRNAPEHAAVAADELRSIGCESAASVVDRAVSALGLATVDVNQILAVLEAESEEREELLDECDNFFYEYPDDIARRLLEFVKANRQTIVIP